jgi:hypothetical protein
MPLAVESFGEQNGEADETLVELGHAFNRKPGERGSPLRRAA